jgi:hypothetical protein
MVEMTNLDMLKIHELNRLTQIQFYTTVKIFFPNVKNILLFFTLIFLIFNSSDSQKAAKKTGKIKLHIMLTKNLISAAIAPSGLTEAKQLIQTLTGKFPFLLSLTTEQRTGGMKLGDKTVSFVDKVIDYSKTNNSLVPPYLDMAEFAKDYKLTKDLLEILRTLKPLVQNMEDTATEAGIEALSAAMVFYNSVKAGAKQGVPGAQAIYEDLQKRFPGASGVKQTTPVVP